MAAADPEEDDGSEDDDKNRFTIDSKQTPDGGNETFVLAINPVIDLVRAANEAAKDNEVWKDDGLTIIANDALLKESIETYRRVKQMMNP